MSKANRHCTTISRRAALAGMSVIAGSASLPAAVIARSDLDGDAKILALDARRRFLLAEAKKAAAAWKAATGDVPDEVNDGRYTEASDIEETIFRTPAATVAGIMVKLHVAVEFLHPEAGAVLPSVEEAYQRRDLDYAEWATCSAWADATRIVTGAQS